MSLTAPLRAPLRAPPTFLAPCLSRQTLHLSHARRSAHTSTKQIVPAPTPFCPDVPTFLSLIGRQMSQHASKFTSWEALFGSSSDQLKEMGVEPARSRRYLLWWRDQFRRGHYGIGGDMIHVVDGMAEVRVRKEADGSRVAVNVPIGNDDMSLGVAVKGIQVAGPGTGRIQGSHFASVKGSQESVAHIKVTEGIWEIKRGRKIHGGERRRKNVLSRIAAKARGTLT